MGDQTARYKAKLIVYSPRLRAKFFEDPGKVLAQVVPGKWPFGLGVSSGTTGLREQVLAEVIKIIGREMVNLSVRAEADARQYFEAAIRNPERTFTFVLRLSTATFAVGVALIAAGLVAAFAGDDNAANTIVASTFGAGGVVGALGSVYTMSRRGLSLANADYAQIRLILNAFAIELRRLRGLGGLRTQQDVLRVNLAIREAMTNAVDLIQTRVKVDVTLSEPQPRPLVRDESGGGK